LKLKITSSAVNGVPFDALAQVEAPHGRRGLRPLGGEQGNDRHVLAAADQGIVDAGQEAELQRLVERVRVHRLHVAGVGDAQRHAVAQAAGQRERDGKQGGSDLHRMGLEWE
jgi:transcriptional regulator of nitric oxide reductase